jgi:hypothetical protein
MALLLALAVGVAAQEATKAIALAARPEAERLVLAVKLARKREETAGISPVVSVEAAFL